MIAWLLTNTLTAALLAGLVYAVIRVGKPAPGVRHALWLIVLLKLVSPVEFLWSVPVMVRSAPAAEETPLPIEPLPPMPAYGLVSEELIEVPVGADALPVFAVEDRVVEEALPPPIIEAAPVVAKPAPESKWEWWLLAVWVVGGAAAFVRMTRDTWRFGRFAQHAKKAPDELVSEVAVVANRLGLRTPDVRKLAGLASPVMWCVGRPVLLWPADLDRQVTGDGRRAVIAHELAHLRRRDHWVRRLEMLAAVAHWWNPIFWLARRRLRADAELACDEWAAGQADRRAYAEALLAVCSFQPRRRPAPAVGVLGEGKRDMQERLTLIMKPTTPSRAAFAAKLCVCLFGLAAVPAWTLGQAPPPSPAQPEPTELKVVQVEGELTIRVQDLDEKLATDPVAQAIQDQIQALTERLEQIRRTKQKTEAQRRTADELLELKKRQAELQRQPSPADAARLNDLELAKRLAEVQRQVEEASRREKAALEGAKVKDAAQATEANRMAARLTELVRSVRAADASQKLIAGQNGVKVIGPDGKEMPGVIVIIDKSKIAGSAPATAKPLAPPPPSPTNGIVPPASNPAWPVTNPGWPGWKPPTPGPAANPGWNPGWQPTTPSTGEYPGWSPAQVNEAWEKFNAAPKSTASPGTMTLSRATYKLPKAQAAMLATLLNGLKHPVMETKTDGDTLVVTTTPEAQAVVQRFVAVIAGDKVLSRRTETVPLVVDLDADGMLFNVEFTPAALPDDATFLRRFFLDTRGTPPTPEEIRKFVADPDKDKRKKLTEANAVQKGLFWLFRNQADKPAGTKKGDAPADKTTSGLKEWEIELQKAFDPAKPTPPAPAKVPGR